MGSAYAAIQPFNMETVNDEQFESVSILSNLTEKKKPRIFCMLYRKEAAGES